MGCCTVGIGSVQALDLLESMGDDLMVEAIKLLALHKPCRSLACEQYECYDPRLAFTTLSICKSPSIASFAHHIQYWLLDCAYMPQYAITCLHPHYLFAGSAMTRSESSSKQAARPQCVAMQSASCGKWSTTTTTSSATSMRLRT